jgi:hypothetical protein
VNVAKAVGDAEATVKRLLQKPKFLPHEFIDAAAENIDLTAKLLLLNRDSMRWLVANCQALLAKPSRNGS